MLNRRLGGRGAVKPARSARGGSACPSSRCR
jgi:hypothetical protein